MDDRMVATDVPMLRRRLVEWLTSELGGRHYEQVIRLGHMRRRPAGPADLVGPMIAAYETDRLFHADLWYIDDDMCDMVITKASTMPRLVPIPQDLPSEYGFVIFGRPVIWRDPMGDAAAGDTVDTLGVRDVVDVGLLADLRVGVDAVVWGPLPDGWMDAPAGGVWMSFYTRQCLGDIVRNKEIDVFDIPALSMDNETIVLWCPDYQDGEGYPLPEITDRIGSQDWASMIFTVFRLVAQQNLVAVIPTRTARPERRRTTRAGLPPRDIRIVRLRGTQTDCRGTTNTSRTHD